MGFVMRALDIAIVRFRIGDRTERPVCSVFVFGQLGGRVVNLIDRSRHGRGQSSSADFLTRLWIRQRSLNSGGNRGVEWNALEGLRHTAGNVGSHERLQGRINF